MYVYTHTQSFHISCTLLYLQIWPAGAGAVPVWTSGVEGYRNSEARWDETVRSNKINKSGRLKMRQDLDKVKSRFWRARPDQATPRGDCLHRSWQVWYVPLCTAAREGQTGLQTLSKEDYTYCPVRLIKSEGANPTYCSPITGSRPEAERARQWCWSALYTMTSCAREDNFRVSFHINKALEGEAPIPRRIEKLLCKHCGRTELKAPIQVPLCPPWCGFPAS